MPLYKTRAIVIKSQRWGEADRIVTFYTEQVGKVRGIARSARRMKSRFGSALEPFRLVELTLFEKNVESLARISQVDIADSFERLRESLPLMTAAARIVNFIQAVTPDRDPNHAVFQTLRDGLSALESSDDPELCALLLQIHILGLTGFRPQVHHCTECGVSAEVSSMRFFAQSGGMMCFPCSERSFDRGLSISPGSIAFIQQARRLPFDKITRLRASGQIRQEVKQAIEAYVEEVAGKSLPSMNLYSPSVNQPDRFPSFSKEYH
ncbi:MAG: DNA repair protein RecO [Nitrospirales bacterium]|nr:MAG: DNA repair protein RecO [Nitrospirales bacterium]